MKSRKIILFIVFVLGILGLLLMASFKTANACEYANSNMEYIKDQTETAISATELPLAKYYAYKAINGIEKTRSNFEACGCEEAIASLDIVLDNLKEATKTDSHDTSKEALERALKNTLRGINELKDFGLLVDSPYDDDILVLNTKDALNIEDEVLLPKDEKLEKRIHNGLKDFEVSIDRIVVELECDEARKFIKKTYDNASITLLNTELTRPKKIYHQRVKTITQNALHLLEECK